MRFAVQSVWRNCREPASTRQRHAAGPATALKFPPAAPTSTPTRTTHDHLSSSLSARVKLERHSVERIPPPTSLIPQKRYRQTQTPGGT